jgi:hypothetical protein
MNKVNNTMYNIISIRPMYMQNVLLKCTILNPKKMNSLDLGKIFASLIKYYMFSRFVYIEGLCQGILFP